MLEFLRSWIINIVTISIILILFEILIPTGKIKKVINLVSGFVLIVAVINPFLALKNKDFSLGDSAFEDSYYMDKKEVEASSKLLQNTQMKQISEVYKKKLTSRIEEELGKMEGVSGAKAEVEINEDYSSEKFGEVTRVTVELKRGEKQNESDKVKPVISIKKIDISALREKKEESEDLDTQDRKLAEQVRENLNKTLEIDKENIHVTVA